MKKFFFLSGLPRSGSTVLGALLSQNPQIYVTPTSPLLDLLCFTENSWSRITQTKAWSEPAQLPNVYRGIIQSIYEHIDRPVIIDKHRAWARNIKGVTHCFGHQPKIICTVRDIAEVLASYLSLARAARTKNRGNFIDQMVLRSGLALTDENFCDALWNNSVSDPYVSLMTGFQTAPRCLHFVEYRDLVLNPAETLRGIYNFLELPPFEHHFEGIINLTPESDEHWGLEGLHHVRQELKITSKDPREILGQALYGFYRDQNLEFWRRP